MSMDFSNLQVLHWEPNKQDERRIPQFWTLGPAYHVHCLRYSAGHATLEVLIMPIVSRYIPCFKERMWVFCLNDRNPLRYKK